MKSNIFKDVYEQTADDQILLIQKSLGSTYHKLHGSYCQHSQPDLEESIFKSKLSKLFMATLAFRNLCLEHFLLLYGFSTIGLNTQLYVQKLNRKKLHHSNSLVEFIVILELLLPLFNWSPYIYQKQKWCQNRLSEIIKYDHIISDSTN